MKRIITLLLFALFVFTFNTTFTSCGDNDDVISVDDYDTAILGTWEVVESYRVQVYHDNKTGLDEEFPDSDYMNGSTFRFTPTKVYRKCYAYGYNDLNKGYEYKLVGDILSVGMSNYFKIKIQGNKMIWDGNLEYEKDNHWVMKKIEEFEL